MAKQDKNNTNKNLKQELENAMAEEIDKGKFDGNAVIEEYGNKPCFFAGIDAQELRNIKIKYNPDYEQENPGKSAIAIKDITRHEINHKGYGGFNGCPRTLENHAEQIIEPMAEILAKKGYCLNDIHYIANAFEDTVLHDDLNKEFSLDGITDFFDDVGRHDDFSEFYEAHAKINLYLWGNKKQKKEMQRHFKHPDKVKKVLESFLKRTGIEDLKQEITINGKKSQVKDRQAIREFLNDEKNWPELSKIYAEEFSKLMQPGYALPLFNHSGKGTKGRESEKSEKAGNEENQDGGQQPSEPYEGNPFDKEMYKQDFKKQRMRKAYENDEGIPAWLDSFEALDIVYQNLAQKLNLKVETFTKQTSMPIYHYGKRPFDPDKDKLKHVTFGFDDKGKVELKKKRWHQDMPLEYKIHEKGFPELRFCLLDTSGSMQESPSGSDNTGRTSIIPWGDNSKYHFALLGWYGLLEYLKQNHLLKQTNINLGNFSNKTVIGQGLTEAKKIALKPQFGNTYIDLDKVKKMFKDRGMLIFTISDGEIANWDEIKDEFINHTKNHYYFHLQIGSKNEATKDLEKAGLHVEYIKSARDLATKVIDLTDKLYRSNKK